MPLELLLSFNPSVNLQFALTTMYKRKRGDKWSDDDMNKQLRLASGDRTSAEIAVLHLMNEFDLDLKELKAKLTGMNDPYFVVLRCWLNTFSSRKGLECRFL